MSSSLRVLVLLPNPADGQPFDAEAEFQTLVTAVKPLVDTGQLQLIRLEDSSETALRTRLTAEPWNVLHFIGRGKSRGAGYATLILEGHEKRARAVTARHLGSLLLTKPSLDAVVLQCPLGDVEPFDDAAEILVAHGLAAIVTKAPASPADAREFARLFYTALAAGDPLSQAADLAGGTAVINPALRGRPVPERAAPPAGYAIAGAGPAAPPGTPAEPGGIIPEAAPLTHSERLELRRNARQFDVFLCHNNLDKAAVKRIGLQLKSQGILPWLDDWELRPGIPWQRLLEEQIEQISAAAVFIGPLGVGPWQSQEIHAFLQQFVDRGCPVIPVLLSDAPAETNLPLLLRNMGRVDFRGTAHNPIERLIWGITGRRTPME